MTISCLMLDVDGVLVRGRPSDGQRWETSLFEDLGVRPELLVEHFFKVHWADIVIGRADLQPRLATALEHIAPNVSTHDLIRYWFEMDSRVDQNVLGDVRMARQDGLRVYLATNQEHMRAAHLMDTIGLGADVDGIIYSADKGCKKPDAAFFENAASRVACGPDALLLVDDTIENVAAASAAGWSAEHWDGNERLSAIWLRHGR